MGNLYIVSTPIGNLQDITLRAISTLKEVDLIACEDTRMTGNLLHHLGIKKEMFVLNDNNEENKLYELIESLQEKNLALVSDAGTPLISDPGFKLVRIALQKGIKVVSIPGPSAVTAALSVAGVPTDKFIFLGFPPDSYERKKNFFLNILISLRFLKDNKLNSTAVFFESPHRILKTLDAIREVFGDIELSVARELTKIHEEVIKGKISEVREKDTIKNPKGEFVILLHT